MGNSEIDMLRAYNCVEDLGQLARRCRPNRCFTSDEAVRPHQQHTRATDTVRRCRFCRQLNAGQVASLEPKGMPMRRPVPPLAVSLGAA
jgi:hypothetical protein